MSITEANVDVVKDNQEGDKIENKDKSDNEEIVSRQLPIGPIEGVDYPIKVTYCGVCTLPIEYCQYYPAYDKCKEWLENNLPDEFNKLDLGKSQL